ncbi:DUF6753 family protein [Crocosphaera chwakensis]|uniref:Uncharacterized protein n=1 Tax=Crocosphaera chwakensis CCY0110 TaxID=391612 RepID=A3IZE1_9CHRO|nr:DUF6753 family protein [Crocosphaera chwakensis]EAZ88153.1 hypothetical protein CY0110_14755 [Crocosphaera chwakensis CCY0110]
MEATITEIKDYIKSNSEIKSYIDLALKDVTPDMKEEVFRFLVVSKVKPDDPLFKLMLACHYFNLVTLNAPNEIEKAFEVGTVNLLSLLAKQTDELKSASVKQIEANISRSVNRLLEKQSLPTPKRRWLKRIAFGCGGLLLFGLGAISAYHYAQMQYQSTLEIENRQLLTWAKSKEGRFAFNLIQWNPGLLDGSCSKSVARLGIGWAEAVTKDGQLVGDRRATTGYCVTWRIPPEQRKFQ